MPLGAIRSLLDQGRTAMRTRQLRKTCPDLLADAEFIRVFDRCRAYTMTSIERMYGLYQAVQHIARNRVPGDIVECGVWRGGSAMACALTLLELEQPSRQIYLYDTFEGMSAATDKDRDLHGRSVDDVMKSRGINAVGEFCNAPIDQVKAAMHTTGYPADKLHFVRGKVEETIPATIPEQVALLRLDTDWYESTYHELVHLYPRLASHGVLILDDYGHWQGARQAADQYFAENQVNLLLHRLDYTGRMGIKI